MTVSPAYYTVTSDRLTLISNPYLSINQVGAFSFVKDIKNYVDWSVHEGTFGSFVTLTILAGGDTVLYSDSYYIASPNLEPITIIIEQSQSVQVEYYFHKTWSNPGGSFSASDTLTFVLGFIANRYPLKKWTITDVINRCCDTVIPLKTENSVADYTTKKPRFRLQGVIYDGRGSVTDYEPNSLAERLDKIISPEFAFTKMTFREQLKQVGGRIHGEPRITSLNYDEDGTPWFEIGFDFYGSNEQSNIKNRHRVSAGFKTDINDYCTNLDSSVDNLVNQLDWAQGVVVEPFQNSGNGGGISLRCETTTTRMAEDNSTFIPTALPIYQLGGQKRVYCTYIPNKGVGKWDITPYIFEEADYNNLSSYDGTYPFCKAYALYYTQGQKNIKGLFFKNPSAISPIFESYAIKNILENVLGEDLSISGQEYMRLQFQIEYLPLYSARVKTSKQTVIGGLPRALAYNQGANIIENTYYGENLKGVVERLGNVEKTYTYHLAFLSDIPKAGMLFDDNYYISAVSVEFLPTYIKCTVGLSKDFNRLSSYVGISSNVRMWEVSEKQAFERESIVSEYILITQDGSVENDSRCFWGGRYTAQTLFNDGKGDSEQVTNALVKRYSMNGFTILPEFLSLPALSTAMGNSMLFSFRFEDNYNSAQKSVYVSGRTVNNVDTTTGYWGAYTPYSDYYGRFYWLNFAFFRGNTYSDRTNVEVATAQSLPQGILTNAGFKFASGFSSDMKIRYRKDSREIPSITYELNIVSDDESIIIGSALASNCSLVNAKPRTYQLYVFRNKLNKLNSEIDLSSENAVLVSMGNIDFSDNDGITIPTIPNMEQFKAWAIVTAPDVITETVSDEDGNTTTQSIQVGGELVIGQNKIPENKTFYFRIKEKIYEI